MTKTKRKLKAKRKKSSEWTSAEWEKAALEEIDRELSLLEERVESLKQAKDMVKALKGKFKNPVDSIRRLLRAVDQFDVEDWDDEDNEWG